LKYFITGSTGFIGSALANKLAVEGHTVHALVRSEKKAEVFNDRNIKIFKGDLDDKTALRNAMQECNVVFHLAAYAQVWSKDPDASTKINIEGTKNVIEAAINSGVDKFVFTSTAGTIEPSDDNKASDESTPRKSPYFNEYEKTKARAEEEVLAYTEKGIEVIIVNPSRVYGPGLMSDSNAVTLMIKKYNEGKWRLIPGNGSKIGNYVYIDDVINGHILASKVGKSGEKYILGGENLSFNEFFDILKSITGKSFFLFRVPYIVMLISANLHFALSRLTGKRPRITPAWIRKYLSHWMLSSAKAEKKLSYTITPFEEGAKKTLRWIKENDI